MSQTAGTTVGRENPTLPDVRQAYKTPLPCGWCWENSRRKDTYALAMRSEFGRGRSRRYSNHSGLGSGEQDYLGTTSLRGARDLDGVFLVVVATPVKTLNRTVFEQAQQRRILCNVVRDRSLCDFYYPAVVRRGPLQIAISTASHSGALAQRLRKQFEAQFGPEWESWLHWLGEARASLYDDPLSPKRRRTMLRRLASQKKQAEFFRRWGYPSNRGERH